MYILLWLLFGALVGWIASILMRDNYRTGLIANIIYGLIGSALGIWLFEIAGFGAINTFSFLGIIVSIGGAALLIAIVSRLRRR
jgi:uncharacterized membrane protein YeaQ/YmgE (transglycosylase-associated protein family)